MRFTKEHEWVRDQGDGTAFVGISNYAAEALGDVVYVELPEAGRVVKQGEAFGVVESVKAASDVYAPVDLEIIEGNPDLGNDPEAVNAVPESGAWFVRARIINPSQLEALMDRAAYEEFLGTL
ncbi:MAG: glycine cleavage system protein GcvH [Asticcacaulis sp.]